MQKKSLVLAVGYFAYVKGITHLMCLHFPRKKWTQSPFIPYSSD